MPAVLVGNGIVGLESHTIDFIDRTARNDIIENIDCKLTIDDFPQYGPFLSVYGLHAFGIKSKNNFFKIKRKRLAW